MLSNFLYFVGSTILYFILWYLLKNWFVFVGLLRLLLFISPFLTFVYYYIFKGGVIIRRIYPPVDGWITCLVSLLVDRSYNSGFKFLYSFKNGFNYKIVLYMFFIRYINISFFLYKICVMYYDCRCLFLSLCSFLENEGLDDRIIVKYGNVIFNPPKVDIWKMSPKNLKKYDKFEKEINRSNEKIKNSDISEERKRGLEKNVKNLKRAQEKLIEEDSGFKLRTPSPGMVENMGVEKFAKYQVDENDYKSGMYRSINPKNGCEVWHPAMQCGKDKEICFVNTDKPLESGGLDSSNGVGAAYEYVSHGKNKSAKVCPSGTFEENDKFVPGSNSLSNVKKFKSIQKIEDIRKLDDINYSSDGEVFKNLKEGYSVDKDSNKVVHPIKIKRKDLKVNEEFKDGSGDDSD